MGENIFENVCLYATKETAQVRPYELYLHVQRGILVDLRFGEEAHEVPAAGGELRLPERDEVAPLAPIEVKAVL